MPSSLQRWSAAGTRPRLRQVVMEAVSVVASVLQAAADSVVAVDSDLEEAVASEAAAALALAPGLAVRSVAEASAQAAAWAAASSSPSPPSAVPDRDAHGHRCYPSTGSPHPLLPPTDIGNTLSSIPHPVPHWSPRLQARKPGPLAPPSSSLDKHSSEHFWLSWAPACAVIVQVWHQPPPSAARGVPSLVGMVTTVLMCVTHGLL